jgi:hypothetical protein
MAGSTLDPDNFPVSRRAPKLPPGHDVRSLGPSDTSDSGSDMAGPGVVNGDELGLDRGTNEDFEAGSYDDVDGSGVGDYDLDDNSDSKGTGEHMTAGREPRVEESGDIGVDRIVGADDAGLGDGLDQAEEARLGMTDEELEQAARGAENESESLRPHRP